MHAFDRFKNGLSAYDMIWQDLPGACNAHREVLFPLLRDWLFDRITSIETGVSNDLYHDIAYKGFLNDQWEAIRDDDFREMFWKA